MAPAILIGGGDHGGEIRDREKRKGPVLLSAEAGNGEIILSSEQYSSKAAAQGGVDSVKKNAANDERYEHKTSTGGQRYFVLKAANAETIGRSQMYSSEAAMKKGIESVKSNAPSATVDDLT